MEQHTLEKKLIPFADFSATLRKHNVKAIYAGFYTDGFPTGVMDIESKYFFGPATRIGIYKMSMDAKTSVFDIKILNGHAHDLDYLTEVTRLKEALTSAHIPFTDERNVDKLKTKATEYARKLLDAAEKLK